MFIIELISSFSCPNIFSGFFMVKRIKQEFLKFLFSDIILDLTEDRDLEELNPSDDEENEEDPDWASFEESCDDESKEDTSQDVK